MFSKYFAAVAASALIAAPVAAAPTNPASSLSVTKSVRAATPSTGKSEIAAGGSGLIIAIVAAAAVIVGIIIIADDDNDSDSN
ncbi:hypothetical protein SAMN05216382_3139 [Sphingomonas palmae]|uniref:Uncharacterized protein n=1 Tax=Sphingomonas palmae TaxID=1855283 RepID=A0A1H7V047_9SPHN|nr:hypothetical protein [Sphingomonas palmae]SEM02572.1 hypothetical protein SAMN05216382_3139 [Sphingomonas palmae]